MNRLRPYLYWHFPLVMMALTLVYLAVELSFNASLLNLTGTLASPADIDRVEVTGRCISAVAVVLALIGMITDRALRSVSYSKKRYVMTLLLVCVPVAFGVYHGEKAFIDFLADHSSGHERKAAAMSLLMREGLLTNLVRIDGMDLDELQLQTPEGMTFSSLLPFLGSGVNEIASRVEPAVNALCQNQIESQILSPDELIRTTYLPAINAVRDIYNNQYVKGSNAYAKALREIPSSQQSAWKAYLAELESRKMTQFNISKAFYDQVRTKLRSSGVPVQDNWLPYDQDGFAAAVERQVRGRARQTFRNGATKALGTPFEIEPGLSFPVFATHPIIQSRLKNKLAPLFADWKTIPINMSGETFLNKIYRPVKRTLIRETQARYRGKAETYADGRENEYLGRKAYRATVAPPIALFLSLIGAIGHVMKFSNFFLMLFIRPVLPRLLIVCSLAGGLFFYSSQQITPLTSTHVYQALESSVAGGQQEVLAKGVTWIVKAQPLVYPANNWLRERVSHIIPLP